MRTEPGCYNIGRKCKNIGQYRQCIHCNIALTVGALVTIKPVASRPPIEFTFYTNEAGKLDYAESTQGDL